MEHKVPEISQIVISFAQLRKGSFFLGEDKFNIAAEVLDSNKQDCALSCPNNTSDENPAYFFMKVEGSIAGRVQMFGSKLKAGNEILPCGTASALEVAEPYRKLGIGADVMSFFTFSVPYNVVITSGLSEMALPMYKILKYKILEFPRLMFPCNSRSIIKSKGIDGILLKLSSSICNVPIKMFKARIKHEARKIDINFSLKNETEVPKWVDNIVMNDGHKYMEVHDQKWMQWNLNHNLNGQTRDKQYFYGIYRGTEPVAFFMTKERYRETAGGVLHNVLIGSIVEWGTKDESILSETDIYKLAFTTFNDDLDIIETATANQSAIKEMKRFGFIPHGYAHIAFKDNTKKYKDASDINLWRVRYGYADVILT